MAENKKEQALQLKIEQLTAKLHTAEQAIKSTKVINENRLDAIISALPDITFIFDEDGRYLEILTSRHELLYDELIKLKGKLIHDILPQNKADLCVDTIKKCLSSGVNQIVEYDLDVPLGKIWFKGRVAPILSSYDNKKAVVWIATETTERKKIETQLQQAQKMKAVGILTGGIAHEFNNLLSPILGYSDFLFRKKSKEDPDYARLEKILTASHKAKTLVQQMLAYGRHSLVEKEHLDFVLVLLDALKVLENNLPNDIVIIKNMTSDVPTIKGIPVDLQQVIINLCNNACQAMPDGGEITVTLQFKDGDQVNQKFNQQASHYICLSVKDTGVGMEKDMVEHIFDPFFTTREVGQGSGLGLSVAEGIAELHNGFIEVESEAGYGSTFHLFLPLPDEL